MKKNNESLQTIIQKIIQHEIKPVKDRMSLLPTKDEFYKKMDEVITELQTTRQEQVVLTHQVSNHEDRIGVIEEQIKIVSD